MFRFLQNYPQANVNHREVHSVWPYVMGPPLCLHKFIILTKIFVSCKTLSVKVNVCTALHALSFQVLV